MSAKQYTIRLNYSAFSSIRPKVDPEEQGGTALRIQHGWPQPPPASEPTNIKASVKKNTEATDIYYCY